MSDKDTSEAVSPLFQSKAAPYIWLFFGLVLGLSLTMALLVDRSGKGKMASDIGKIGAQYADGQQEPIDLQKLEGEASGQPDPNAHPDPTAPGEDPPLTGAPDAGSGLPSVQGPPPPIPSSPNPLAGTIPGQPGMGSNVPPVNPVVMEDPKSREAETTVQFHELFVLTSELDFDAARGKLLAAAKSHGGKLLVEVMRDPEFPDMGGDFVFSIPSGKADAFRQTVLRMPSASTTDEWQGPFVERHYRVNRFLRDKVYSLETQLGKLLVKYLDDAPEVVRVKRDLDRFKSAESNLKPAPVTAQAFRVTLGGGGRTGSP